MVVVVGLAAVVEEVAVVVLVMAVVELVVALAVMTAVLGVVAFGVSSSSIESGERPSAEQLTTKEFLRDKPLSQQKKDSSDTFHPFPRCGAEGGGSALTNGAGARSGGCPQGDSSLETRERNFG